MTPTFADNLTAVRRALAVQRCVLLTGAVGSGKSALAHHAAAESGAEIVVVGLDSSVDVKDLVGTFRSADAGTFEFQFGPLSKAVREGKWLLLEDVDLASPDVSSALVALLQRGEMYVPELDVTLSCPPQFRLLGTVQAGGAGSATSRQSARGGATHWALWGPVHVVSPDIAEQFSCVSAACPGLNPSVLEGARQAVQQVLAAGGGDMAELIAGTRDVTRGDVKKLLPKLRLSLRELLKWGRRMRLRRNQCASGAYLDSQTRDTALMEALDVWCRHLPSKGYVLMTRVLGAAMQVTVEKQDFLLGHRRPELRGPAADGYVQCGRQRLQVTDLRPSTSDPTFADTKAALALVERLAVCVSMAEPALLTGETGVGKTYMVQHLAGKLGQPLVVHNMNQQSESSDLIGGYRPSDLAPVGAAAAEALRAALSGTYSTDDEKTESVLVKTAALAAERNWGKMLRLATKVVDKSRAALRRLLDSGRGDKKAAGTLKKIHLWDAADAAMKKLAQRLEAHDEGKSRAQFEWVEGSLMKCFRDGSWLLLDEVNLADAEILERLAQAVDMRSVKVSDEGATASARLTLPERGGSEGTVDMHPNFRLFACMNPPTDVGKKDLPPSLKGRFTELYCDELTDRSDLRVVVGKLIGSLVPQPPIDEVVDFYLECRKRAGVDLTDNDPACPKPHYSLRTLTRALRFTRQVLPSFGFQQALLEGIHLCFYSQLSRAFHAVMDSLVNTVLLRGRSQPQAVPPPRPPGNLHVCFDHLWIEVGPLGVPAEEAEYVVTPSVRHHLRNLARVVVANRAVLLQGPTAAGKTSMVDYLARATGHKCVRINNHETTDIQEYLGQYLTDDDGRLRFCPGPLVEACKHGHWVILDELNLAPSEILEALNRLLDDNRELLVPETMEVIRPHSHFRLFATQNPPGLYGGRKQLSRAVRNRFMEILVDDIPREELKTILHQRYKLPETMADRMVAVMAALQLRRQGSAVLSGKHVVTPRDLFRWALRGPFTYDELACHGMFLLGDRCRRPEERQVVRHVLQDTLKAAIPPDHELYDPLRYPKLKPYWEKFQYMCQEGRDAELQAAMGGGRIIPTEEFRRLFTLVGLCLAHKEPLVLVGETGGGKTTVCQLWAYLSAQKVTIVNCHQHSETADFLGAHRPAPPASREQGRLFEWHDGPLIAAMKSGELFMLDEVSLADDAVLERLNSALEPARTITLPEKGGSELEEVVAHSAFRVMATMNPAGDFGKKELSPALRNRMTEVYVTSLSRQSDLEVILRGRLDEHARGIAPLLVAFLRHFQDKESRQISIRDVMSVTRFVSRASSPDCGELREPLSVDMAYVQGIDAVLLAGIAIGTGMAPAAAAALRQRSIQFVSEQLGGRVPRTPAEFDSLHFWQLCGRDAPELKEEQRGGYSFSAPTTQRNLSAILRTLWVLDGKATLLEGSPGVGKTTLVQTLGGATGKKVFRVNLSEQTDIGDLVGAFLPTGSDEKDGGPRFQWSDGVLLQAMAEGEWVVLDELNLASQSVLEGLNALLDHRGELFVPELGRAFRPQPGFRLFGCQNPLGQGGGRKGLPRSFLNRFTRVWVEAFTREDLHGITQAVFSDLPAATLNRIVDCVSLVDKRVAAGEFGRTGSPWEFNLRDTFRWCELLRAGLPTWYGCLAVMTLRFRTDEDREAMRAIHNEVFGDEMPSERPTSVVVDREQRRISFSALDVPLPEEFVEVQDGWEREAVPAVLPSHTPILSAMVGCLRKTMMLLLVGPTGSGKSKLVEVAARMCGGREVRIFPMSSGTDTVDLLGQFQQKGGEFVWTDSLLVKALERGDWLVLDNAAFASPSVLDRLNGLLEPGGELVLNECGVGPDGKARVVKPHPAFRLFLLLDPRAGTVSRAMRNRGVELYVPALDTDSAEAELVAAFHCRPQKDTSKPPSAREFAESAVRAAAVRNDEEATLCTLITAWHRGHVRRVHKAASATPFRPTMTTLLRAVDLARYLRRQPQRSLMAAVREACVQCYLRGTSPSVRAKEEAALDEVLRSPPPAALPTAAATAVFSAAAPPSTPEWQRLAAFVRAAVVALGNECSAEDMRVRVGAVCLHVDSNLDSVAVGSVLEGMRSGAPDQSSVASAVRALVSTVSGMSLPAASAEEVFRQVDVLAAGIASTLASGGVSLWRLPFADQLLAVARAPGDGPWVTRDRLLAALVDLDAATDTLGIAAREERQVRKAPARVTSSWRAAAGAAAPLAELIPESAPDAAVLEWLHCWLRVRAGAEQLESSPAAAAALAKVKDYGALVTEHFGLAGDPRPPLLWKRGGHPPPCPPELREALSGAAEAREHAIANEARFSSPLAASWRHAVAEMAVRLLPAAAASHTSAAECAALCRLASTRGAAVAADALPLKLAAEGAGAQEELRHPLVVCVAAQVLSTCASADDDEAAAGATLLGDGLSSLLAVAPGPPLLAATRVVAAPAASMLIGPSQTARAAIEELLGVAVALPNGGGREKHPTAVLLSTAARLLLTTLQPFADSTKRGIAACNATRSPSVAAAVTAAAAAPTSAESLRKLADAMRTCGTRGDCVDLRLAETIAPFGAAVAEVLAQASERPLEDPAALCRVGCGLAMLAAWRMHLLRPSSPLDPALRAQHKANAAKRWAALRAGQLRHVTDVEAHLCGVLDTDADGWSEPVNILRQHCAATDGEAEKAAAKAIHRRLTAAAGVDRFPGLFWQARQFASSVVSHARMESAVARLVSSGGGSGTADELDAAVRQADIAVSAATRLSNDFETKFAGYEDVTAPIRASASLLAVGFGVAARAAAAGHAAARKSETAGVTLRLHRLLPALTAMPAAALPVDCGADLHALVRAAFDPSAVEAKEPGALWQTVSATIEVLRTMRLRAALLFSSTAPKQTVAGRFRGARRLALYHVEGVYGAWVALWDVIEMEEKRREEMEAEQFKWRARTQEIEGDDEALARTLRELFPSYASEFEVKDADEEEEELTGAAAEAAERAAEERVAAGVRRMKRDLLGKGELLDVVLEYVSAVGDATRERMSLRAPPSVDSDGYQNTPTDRAAKARGGKRKRAGQSDARAKRARELLLASPEQLEEDAMPQVPAPDEAMAAALLDASEADLIKKRLNATHLRPAASWAQFRAVKAVLRGDTAEAKQARAVLGPHAAGLRGAQPVAAAASALVLARRRCTTALSGTALSDDVTDRVRSGFNIYQEPDVCEAAHGLRHVAALKDKVAELLEEFPDHPPLVNLATIAERVLALDPASEPLMKVLQGTEVVLKGAHEWETTAHKGVSVSAHISAIGSAVLRWRRLELHCWPHLLHARRRMRGEQASRHAFTLWRICESALRKDAKQEVWADDGTGTGGLCGAVQRFVAQSVFGDFDLRVRLLAAHGQRLALALGDGDVFEPKAGQALRNLFLNTASYFATFLGPFRTTFSTEAHDVRKKLADFIKIQRWQDANYYALTACTAKSHNEIAKVLKRWDALLAKPLMEWLEAQDQVLDDKLVLPDEGGALPPKPAKGSKPRKGQRPTKCGLAVEPEELASPFTIAVCDAADNVAVCDGVFAEAAVATCSLGRLTDTVLERVMELQPPAKAKRSVKTRALLTLLDTLRDAGMELGTDGGSARQDAWDQRAALEETAYPVALSLAAGSDGTKMDWPATNGGDRERKLWLSAERDVYRLMHAMRRFQTGVAAPSTGDVNTAQIHRMQTHARTMWAAVRQQRAELCPAAAERLSLWNAICTTAAGSQEPLPSEAGVFEELCRELSDVCRGAEQSSTLVRLCGDSAGGMPVKESEDSLRRIDSDARSPLGCLAASATAAASAIAAARSAPGVSTMTAAAAACRAAAAAAEAAQLSVSAVAAGLAAGVAPSARAAEAALRAAASPPSASSFDKPESLGQACRNGKSKLVLPPPPSGTAPPGEGLDFDALSGAGLWRCNVALTKACALLDQDREVLEAAGSARISRALLSEVLDAREHAELRLREVLQYHAAFVRAALVVIRLYGTLLRKGFCGSGKDEDDDEGEGDGEGDGKGGLQDGTGMDDGEGAKDVSNELENEDQLMNAKDMEKEQEPQKKPDRGDEEEDEDQGVNVETNFEGELEDADRKDRDDGDDDDDSESKESAPVDGADQEETEQEQKADAGEQLRDAEGDGQKKEKQDKDKFEEEKEEEGSDAEDEREGGWDNRDLDDKMQDQDKDDVSGDGELEARDGQFDDEGDGDDGDDDDHQQEEDGDDKEEDGERDPDAEDEEGSDAEGDQKEDGEGGEEREEGDEGEDGDKGGVNPEEVEDGDDKDEGGEDDAAGDADMPDAQTGKDHGIDDGRAGDEDTAQQDQKRDDKPSKGDDEETPVDQMQESTSGQTMSASADGSTAPRAPPPQKDKDAKKKEAAQKEKGGKEEEKVKPKEKEGKAEEQKADPFKALGQLMEQWKQKMARAEEAQDGREDAEEDDDAGGQDADRYEIVPQDSKAEQLGTAPIREDEEMEKVEEEDFTKEEPKEGGAEDPTAQEDDSDEGDDEGKSQEADDKDGAKQKRPPKKPQRKGKKKEPVGEGDGDEMDVDLLDGDGDEDEAAAAAAAAERGDQLWADMEEQVTPLSHELAEHLRLLLEPTKADRLQGDYKTGKRLSMKKVIAYIASGYKKDKIWMRRTRPNKREYQIVVAIDDSQSMACNGSGPAALRALAVLSRALSIVEAGQVAVTRFGVNADVVQSFDDPLTIDSMAKAMGRFSFSQQGTDHVKLLTGVLNTLDDARMQRGPSSRQTTDLLQLAFVVSDGWIDRKYKREIRELVARAHENQQLVVFVIIDVPPVEKEEDADAAAAAAAAAAAEEAAAVTPAAQARLRRRQREERKKQKYESILQMMDVDFGRDGSVVLKPTMDDFPFPLYVVVREVGQLPSTLADALSQWLEMVQSL